jgi:hypothetical protein
LIRLDRVGLAIEDGDLVVGVLGEFVGDRGSDDAAADNHDVHGIKKARWFCDRAGVIIICEDD